MKKIKEFINNIILVIILLFILSIPILLSYIGYDKLTITIKDKYIKNYNNSSLYIIVDTNNNSYEVSDKFFILKFNSTDIYNSFEIGKSYEIETTGFRVQFLSWYKNINKVYRIE